MKFSSPKAALLETLSRVRSVVEKRTQIPILANVALETGKDTVRLSGTDMDMEISEWTEARVAAPGRTTVPAYALHDIVKKLETDLVTLELKEDRMQITGGKAKFILGTLPAEDFPLFPNVSGDEASITIESEELKKLIQAVRGAVSTEETRYYLNGACFQSHPDGGNIIRACATDGHRLSRADAVAADMEGELPRVIVPTKALDKISGLVEKPSGQVRLTFRANTITVECGTVTFKSKLVDGTFPDESRVIPQEASLLHRFTLSTSLFGAAVDRVRTVCEKTPAVSFSFTENDLRLSAKSLDGNTADDEIPLQKPVTIWPGEKEFTIGFNAGYLLEMTKHFPGEFTLSASDNAAPVTITSTDDPTYLYVIMPMRV